MFGVFWLVMGVCVGVCVLWFVVGGGGCWTCRAGCVRSFWYGLCEWKVKRVVIAVGWDLWECFGRSGVP